MSVATNNYGIMEMVHEQSNIRVQEVLTNAHRAALSSSYNINQYIDTLANESGFECGHSGSHVWIHNEQGERIAIIHNLLR